MSRRAAAWLGGIVLLSGLGIPAMADHAQTSSGKVVAFDHRGGNEWWVEVFLGGQDGSQATAVSATDDGTTWVPLQKKSWGNWAGSFHIEPGHRVMFRASWSGGAQATSCWFTHPAGAEQCATTSSWQVSPMGSVGTGGAQDIAVADGDNDGKTEAYVPTAQGVKVYAWSHQGWTLRGTLGPETSFERVAVGDGNHDGRSEVYATHMGQVHIFFFDGEAWSESVLSVSGFPIGAITVGDVDGDGRREVYLGIVWEDGPVYVVRQVEWQWTWSVIATLPGGTRSLWIGDANGDGDAELVAGSGNSGIDDLWMIDGAGNTWSQTLVHAPRIGGVTGVAAGDGDRDGKGEAYAARAGSRTIHLSRWTGTGWSTSLAATLPSDPMDLALGDGDNDGTQELYAPAANGHLYQVRWSGSAWVVRDLATVSGGVGLAVAVGNADSDSLRELYMTGYPANSCCSNAGVFMVSQHAPPPRPPAPPPFWTAVPMGYGGRAVSADLAVGDVDRDGRNEVYIPLQDGLVQMRWDGTAWVRTLLDTRALGRVVVADLDRDGQPEVYASSQPFSALVTVYQYKPSPTGWQSVAVFTTGSDHPGIGSMTQGDVDGDGRSELYVMLEYSVFDDQAPVPVYMVWNDGTAWRSRVLANIEGGAFSSWVADGNGDGDAELYMAGIDRLWQLDGTGTAWSAQLIARPTDADPDFSYIAAVVAGDVDRDGRGEVYVAMSGGYPGSIYRYTFAAGAWTRSTVYSAPFSGSNQDMFLGDADGDGTQDLYVTNSYGHVHQVRWTGSAWASQQLQHIEAENIEATTDILVGDIDGDGARDLLVAGTNYGRSPGYYLFELSPPRATTFDAAFTGVRGNEWWQQASVTATGGTLAKVEIRLNAGAWQPMAKQSWGWSSSLRAPEGTVVQLRATSTTGATDLSDCYRWIPPASTDASKVACTQPPPPGFDATFSGAKGNSWWVQVNVAGNQPIAGVEARVNCGATWKPLAKQDWGGWAASFNVPDGSKVDFRARSTTGATDLSGGYTWPSGTPTSAC